MKVIAMILVLVMFLFLFSSTQEGFEDDIFVYLKNNFSGVYVDTSQLKDVLQSLTQAQFAKSTELRNKLGALQIAREPQASNLRNVINSLKQENLRYSETIYKLNKKFSEGVDPNSTLGQFIQTPPTVSPPSSTPDVSSIV